MGLKPGMKVLDVGCGIGGPAREIAKFSGATVIGINLNQVQVNRAIEVTLQQGLGHLCTFIQANFNDLPFPDGYFDVVYGIQAVCHSTSFEHAYAGFNRVLKPGGILALEEWVMTPKFDASNPKHAEIRNRIERGNGISRMRSDVDVREALPKAGFELYHDEDIVDCWKPLSEPLPFDLENPSTASYSTVPIPSRDGKSTYCAPKPKGWHQIRSTKEFPIPPTYRPWWFPLTGDKEAMDLSTNREDYMMTKKMLSSNRRWWRFKAWFVWKVLRIGFGEAWLEALDVMEDCVVSVMDGGREGIFSPLWWFISRKVKDPPAELLVPYGLEDVRPEDMAKAHSGIEAAAVERVVEKPAQAEGQPAVVQDAEQ